MDVRTTNLDPRPHTHSNNEQLPRRWNRLPTPPPINPDDYPLLFAEHSAEALDLEDYMRRSMQGIPTLERGQITMSGPRDGWTLADGRLNVEEKLMRRRRMVSSGDWSEAGTPPVSVCHLQFGSCLTKGVCVIET